MQEFYGDTKTKRFHVPLINHIDEGGTILHHIGANAITRDAYFLHPILQSDYELDKNSGMDFGDVETESIILAMEYRRVANSYLSTGSMSDFVGFTSPEIRQMLLADKVQNYKDFLKYHKGKHNRSAELDIYFKNWFKLLGIRFSDYENLIKD